MDYDDGIPEFLRRVKKDRTPAQLASDKHYGDMVSTRTTSGLPCGAEHRPACLMCLGDGTDDDGHTCGGCDGTGFVEHE